MAAFLLNIHAALGQRDNRAHISHALTALKSVVGYRLQLGKLEGLRAKMETMSQKDPKHATLFQTCKFLQEFKEQAAKVTDIELQHPGLLGFDWQASCDRCQKMINENTFLADYISHAATTIIQSMTDLLEKGAADCGTYHEDDERSWKASFEKDTPLAQVLAKGIETIGRIGGRELAEFNQKLKQATASFGDPRLESRIPTPYTPNPKPYTLNPTP